MRVQWQIRAAVFRSVSGYKRLGPHIVTYGRRAMTADKWRALNGIEWAANQ